MIQKQYAQQQLALTLAHRDFEKDLTSYAYFRLHDHAMCEDLVQDTFMKTWKYLVKGGKIEVMKAFLYHVLNHLIVDQYRKHKTASLETLLEKGFEPSIDPSARLFNVLDGQKAIKMIQQMPEKYRRVMQMRYVENLSLEEISKITGQSKNTVAVQAHRGLEKLKALYRPENAEDSDIGREAL
jgi:RNA polymerase sigma-70 factor, ECF subfamily